MAQAAMMLRVASGSACAAATASHIGAVASSRSRSDGTWRACSPSSLSSLESRSPSLSLLREACYVACSGLGSSPLAHSNGRRLQVSAKKGDGKGDGVFGSSGGFGFTKENELLVGRLAMLGFAASLLGEGITGNGIMAQLGLETGIPLNEAEPLVIFFIVFNVLGAIGALGDRGRFVDEPVITTKAAGGSGDWKSILKATPVFGFTKANELFVGRVAQLGFVASILGEVLTGKGALAQLNIESGLPITEIEPVLLFSIVILLTTAFVPGSGRFVDDDE